MLRFFYKKNHLPEPYFLYNTRKKAEIFLAEIFVMFFLTFISLFSLVVYIVRSSTNNKWHFLTYMFLTHMLTYVSNFTSYDGTTINNEDIEEF